MRHADPDCDAAACAAIYAPGVADGYASFEEEPPTAAAMAERIATANARYAWLVAEDAEGRVVGFAYASQHKPRAGYRWAVDTAIYVAPARQGAGTGRALYDALLELLSRQGLRWACAGIALPNDASVGLHEAMGFVAAGVWRDIGHKAGAWRSVGWWQRELTPATDPPSEPGGPQRLP